MTGSPQPSPDGTTESVGSEESRLSLSQPEISLLLMEQMAVLSRQLETVIQMMAVILESESEESEKPKPRAFLDGSV